MKFPALPVMRCDVNCGACCGIVLCKEGEYQKVVEYAAANGIAPVKQGITCPWYQGGTCSVYPVRPGICRLFGHTEDLVCKHGYNVNVSGTLRRLADKAIGNASRCLHEVFEDWWVIIEAGLQFSVRGKK
jgi:Fe-S-cluster containining protein